jgi:hypothetical protein
VKWMEARNLRKNYLKNKKKRKRSLLFSRLKALMSTPSGNLVLRCVKTINDGCWWKSAIKRKSSMITLLTLKRLTKFKRKPKPKSTRPSSSKCWSKPNSWHQTPKCTKSNTTFWLILGGVFLKMPIKRTLSKITLTNFWTRKSKSRNKSNRKTWII